MTGAPYTNPAYAPPVTGRKFSHMLLALLALFVVGTLAVAGTVYWQSHAATPSQTLIEKAVKTPRPQSTYPPMQEERVAQLPPEVKPPPTTPLDQARLAELARQNQAMLHILEDLQRTQRAPAPAPKPPAAPVTSPKPPGPALLITNKVEAVAAKDPLIPEYTLAPGATKLPCVIETAINSDVEGYFTAKVTTNVYDTATGRHLLVPQGSTILGKDLSKQLVYGNERLPTVSLTLTLPNGRSVELGDAPVTDEQGVMGLAHEVDQHYGRLLAAVLIQGVLRGGAQVVTTMAADAAGAGQVASGIAGVGAQTGTQVTGPLLNTRPTIKVFSGGSCSVLLIKELVLPSVWQRGEPRDVPRPLPPTKGAKS